MSVVVDEINKWNNCTVFKVSSACCVGINTMTLLPYWCTCQVLLTVFVASAGQGLTVHKTARSYGLPFLQLAKGLLLKISVSISVLLLRIKVWQNCQGKLIVHYFCVHFVSLALHCWYVNPSYVVLQMLSASYSSQWPLNPKHQILFVHLSV